MWQIPDNVSEEPDLHNRIHVFTDRADAGRSLAELLKSWRDSGAIVVAIPAGGVPVAHELARQLELPLDVLVVSKMTLPWNSEVGYGALAADGTLRINEALVGSTGMDQASVDAGIERTRSKVAARERSMHELIEAQPLAGKPVLLVDDGLASGFTMRVAIDSARAQGAAQVMVAVPTGSSTTVETLAQECDHIYCANIREGMRFAVADAYRQWRDVSENEVLTLIKS